MRAVESPLILKRRPRPAHPASGTMVALVTYLGCEPIERVRARLEALIMANAAPRCGARSKRTGKPCRAAAMLNGRCKVHGGKSTGPRTPGGPRAEQAGKVEARLLLSRSEGGTVARAGGTACAPLSAHHGIAGAKPGLSVRFSANADEVCGCW